MTVQFYAKNSDVTAPRVGLSISTDVVQWALR